MSTGYQRAQRRSRSTQLEVRGSGNDVSGAMTPEINFKGQVGIGHVTARITNRRHIGGEAFGSKEEKNKRS